MSDGNVAADQLRLFIERIERLEEEKKGMQDDIKDVYLEAKSTGLRPQDDADDRAPAEDGEERPRRGRGAARDLQGGARAGLSQRVRPAGSAPMKLYGFLLSPFTQRVLIAARIKGHELPVEPPPGGR